MTALVTKGPTARLAMLHRDDGDGAIGGGVTVLTKGRVSGLNRVKAIFQSDQAPIAQNPTVEQSNDGINYAKVGEIPRDLNQAGFYFEGDFKITMEYVRVTWTQGGVGGTFLRAWVEALADYGVGDDAAGAVSGTLQNQVSDKDTEFTGAIADGAHATANLTALLSNKGVIESLAIISEDQLGWEVHFWTSDGFDDADLDVDSWLEAVSFARADGKSISNAIPGTFRYAATGLSIPYEDADQSLELHVSLVPIGGAKTAGAAGELVIKIGFRAD